MWARILAASLGPDAIAAGSIFRGAAPSPAKGRGPLETAACLRLVLLVLAVLLAGLGQPARADVPPPAWVSTLEREHPLVGKLWAADRRLFQPLDLLAREIVFEELVLLGEVHDNPDHHRLRAWIIDGAAQVWNRQGARSRPPAAVFEHVRVDQSAVLDAFAGLPAGERTATTLLERLDWARSGWPEASRFEPLFAAVLKAGNTITAGDAPRERIREVARGHGNAPPIEPALSAALQDALLTELEASHCGLMPRQAFGGMLEAQRLRDWHLAKQMVGAATATGGAVLFSGNGHVRSDRGVPYYLKALAGGRKIVTVIFAEVERGRDDPASYVPTTPDGKPAADFVVFTPRTERPDPCDEMRAMMAARKRQ